LKEKLMNILFFEDSSFQNLLPLTYTKPVSELRIGILKIREKWDYLLPEAAFSNLTQKYLSEKYTSHITEDNILISGSVLPDPELSDAVSELKAEQGLTINGRLIAYRTSNTDLENFDPLSLHPDSIKEIGREVKFLDHPWQIFRLNGEEIRKDYSYILSDRKSVRPSSTLNLMGEDIFIEEGASIEFATINTQSGPVYIGKDAEVMEGSVIRGPFALCEGGVVKLSAKIYGPTTIGPYSKVGGEINNSVIQGYSNKAHDGFLGNSVIGEWCNLGADTNNSNLKNNYANVRLWSYPEEKFIDTGLQFCGLIMGDHSKCGINTMFNTGTVVGVNANIFGSGFPRNFVPSFSWGGARGFTTYSINRAFEVASLVMSRRNIDFDETEQKILREIYRMTEKFRK
jgi:UDP-N-acetylglucosamine diphosphorylase/glucosamine-1-phosphate N-acetyltransferase